jgi:hypothetical protein
MSDIFGNSPSAGLTDVIITDSTTNGSFTITTLNNETYNLQTPDNGDNLDVLTTDGIGNTYWAPSGGGGGTPSFQDVYNASSTPANINLLSTKPIIFLGTTSQEAFKISSDLSGLTKVEGNSADFNNGKFNALEPLTGDKIDIINDTAIITDRTFFTQDQEFITKKYVDDNIPASQTFQDVYNSSSNPTIVEMVNNKNISFRRLEADILKIGTDFTITTPNIDTQKIEGDYYFPYSSNNLDSWSFATYNFTASASSFVNFDHNPGRAYNKFIPSNPSYSSWICSSGAYDLITGLPSLGAPTTDVVGLGLVLGQYLTLFTSKSISIDGYFIGVIDEVDNPPPVDFQLVGSVDGIVWTLLDTQVGQNIVYPGQAYSFFGGSSFLTKYYRFIVNKIPPNNPTGRCMIGAKTNFNIVSNPNQINLLGDVIEVVSDNFVANNFIKQGGTNQQYLMADGSSLQYSQNSGNSNFYLYDNSDNITTPPPSNGHVGYNNAIQANATILYISHLTSDAIDVDIFFTQLSTIQEVYIQDKNSSVNFIKYTITGTPTIFTNSYIEIPVLYTATIPPALPNGAGTGLTSFGNNHPLILSFFTNSIEVDLRLTTLETKTQYQNASAGTTTFSGLGITADTFIKNGGTNQQYLMADGSISAKFNQNLNTTDNVSFNKVNVSAAIIDSSQLTTKLYVDNKVGTVAITSTDNNLLGVSGISPTFSLTPKYTYAISFGGNNNGTTSQWLLPGSVRSATISNTNVATHQALIPINSTLVWASIQRTTTTGACSLAYSVSNGTAVPITPILTAGQLQNPTPYPLNVNIPAGGNLAMSVLSSVLSGNTIVSLLLRSN